MRDWSAAVWTSIWSALTPIRDGLLKKENPDNTPSMARVNRTAVSMLIRTPIIRVRAKPLGPAVANRNSIRAVRIVSTLASRMVRKPRAYPEFTAERTVLPCRTSSLMRSKMTTLASTATPMVRIMPAMPGRVSVTGIRLNRPHSRTA
ncbi:MAG: hypothetical protein BWY94_01745 [Actinobacteria bacterium ADurb.BinA094]|nr:MAG: hypothetical protein BWY94_01745 [Actinobacteria bacterium ADurb.BinA094]